MAENKKQTKDTRKLTDGQDTGHTEEAGSAEENPNVGIRTTDTKSDGPKDDAAEQYARTVLGEDHNKK